MYGKGIARVANTRAMTKAAKANIVASGEQCSAEPPPATDEAGQGWASAPEQGDTLAVGGQRARRSRLLWTAMASRDDADVRHQSAPARVRGAAGGAIRQPVGRK